MSRLPDVQNLPDGFDRSAPGFVAALRKLEADTADGSVIIDQLQYVPGTRLSKNEPYALLACHMDDAKSGLKNVLWAMEIR